MNCSIISLFLFFALVFPVHANIKNSHIATAPFWDTASRDRKIHIITEVIKGLNKKGVMIRKEAAFYVDEIDINRKGGDPHMLVLPIGEHFKSVAILYKDFDNGQDPDEMIKESLGEEAFQEMQEEGAFEVMQMYYEDWKKGNQVSQNVMP
jgi:hypothetical protein